MKWGERRYQYEDGRLTPLGKIHYGVGQGTVTIKQPYAARKDRYIDKRSLETVSGAKRLARYYKQEFDKQSPASSYERLFSENQGYRNRALQTFKLMDRAMGYRTHEMVRSIYDGKSYYDRIGAIMSAGSAYSTGDQFAKAYMNYFGRYPAHS